jgi:hypothetical protein
MPGWIYTHIASGEKRDQVTAARLNRMGVTAGFPDLVCLSNWRPGAAGHGYLCRLRRRDRGVVRAISEH